MTNTRTAEIKLYPSGITEVRIDPRSSQTLEDATENIAKAVKTGGDVRRPLLVDISGCRPLEPEVRHFYSGQILIDSFLALALLLDLSPLGRTMGNLYLKVAKPGIPTRLTTEREEALHWLATFLENKT